MNTRAPSKLDIRNTSQAQGVAAGLQWVRKEFNDNLAQAGQLVEQHSEQRADTEALPKALAHLHEVRGAAVLIQAYGLALLAEEMKQTVQDLASGAVHEPDPAYAAVVGACVQATDYLDLLQGGQADSALVLQPIVNELRLARGKTLLTEDDLFVAQFRVLGLQLERDPAARAETSSRAEAARLHPVFSVALLGWFKGQDVPQALSRLGRIAEILAGASEERALHQLWRTAAACVEALLSGALDDSLELKRQFGRAGQLMKILAEVGEADAVKQMSDVSLRLLFYAGRSAGTGARVSALRQGLQLDTWLPAPDAVQAARARLRGANTGLLLRVAEELRADLAEVRDSIDVALRAGGSDAEFDATAQRLKRVADTLLVLGLSAESQALAQPVETLREAGTSDPAAWMEFATAVLQVELSLDAALYRQLRAQPMTAAEAASGISVMDMREGTAALLRESLVNLARVKEYAESFIRSGDVSGVPEAARMLDEIAAGFRMLALDHAEELVIETLRFVQSTEFAGVRTNRALAGHFADTIAAIEYFLELKRDGLPGSEQVLDQLAARVMRLRAAAGMPSVPAPPAEPEQSLPEVEEPVTAPVEAPALAQVDAPVVSETARAPEAPAEPAVPVAGAPFELSLMDDAAPAASMAPVDIPAPIASPEYHLVGEPLPEVPPVQSAPEPPPAPVAEDDDGPVTQPVLPLPAEAPPAAAAAPPAQAPPIAPPEVDPEIRQIFIEEAQEVLQTLQRAVPRWIRQPEERDTLATIRRGFHTLKGSGRMVGAQDIGEFSWAIENMLNRVLDRTIGHTADVTDTVREAVSLVPALIVAFRDGETAATRAADVADQARRLAAGKPLDDDSDLVAVFRSDASARLQMITRWLAEQNREVGEYSIAEPVRRAFHTLRGAALAIGAKPIGELSGSLEGYLDGLHRAHLPLSDAGLSLIEDCCTALEGWVARLGEADAPRIDLAPWLQRIEAIRAGADGDAAPPAQAQQLADVFAFEALDLVQKFEADLGAWAAAPREGTHLQALKATVHTLRGAADRAQCAPIAAVAQALEPRLSALGDAPAPPAPAFFETLRKIAEGLYTQLDQFRDGTLAGDGAEWLPLVASLDALAPAAAPVATPAAPAFAAASAAALDPELVEIFLHEGEELIEEIDRHAGAIAADPNDTAAIGAWLRALHTLKGSARVTGMDSIGELAHRLETATETARGESAQDRERFRARLRVAVDGLHELLDEVRSGRSGAADRILAQFEAAGEHAAAAIALPPPSEAAAAASAVVTAEPEAVDQPDVELLEIFAPEAAELLESLGNSLHAWQEQPAHAEFSRQMQRDLHTFKGGARMSGLARLGQAAHALETELVQLEREGTQVPAAALQRIAQELDALHRLYDGYTLGAGAPPPDAPAEPSPSVEAAAVVPAAEPAPEAVAPVEAPIAAPLPSEPVPAEAAPSPANFGWNPELFWKPGEQAAVSEARREAVRVPVERLDAMLNQAGEISIFRSRLEENHAALAGSLTEMAQTITRVREQLRLMEVETEAQIAARGFQQTGADDHRYESQFDPLEMDRYSRMQELSRALAESVSDLSSLHASLDGTSTEAEALLQQQGRITTEVQQSLMGTLMVPFSRQVQRLSRVVRQTAEQNGKKARAEFSGAESELDRNVLERMTAPLEHLLRNSVVHGIEDLAARAAAGKPAEGTVHVSLKREGSQLLIEVRDDGRGLDFDAIRAQAVKKGLMRADAEVPPEDLARFIFAPGFSTARALTQDAGRGVGMDVVAAEVKQLGGTVDVASEAGKGARFRIRLPLMLAVSQALVVQVGEELFALPLGMVEGIARAPREALADMMKPDGRPLEYGGNPYQVRRLGELVGLPAPARIDSRTVPAILMRLGDGLGGSERRVAIVAERLIGNREIVTKPAGPILGSVAGISGATILADGRVMLIVDVPALIAESVRRRLGDEAAAAPAPAADPHRLIMVVDDSITIRRVTERLLTRKGYRVITAKDGLDAMATLQTEAPDAVLLDIEMPRADGFEVAAYIRNTPRIASLPIIMITSRSGDKHREQARSLGVNKYLIKPFQEDQLLAELRTLLTAEEVHA